MAETIYIHSPQIVKYSQSAFIVHILFSTTFSLFTPDCVDSHADIGTQAAADRRRKRRAEEETGGGGGGDSAKAKQKKDKKKKKKQQSTGGDGDGSGGGGGSGGADASSSSCGGMCGASADSDSDDSDDSDDDDNDENGSSRRSRRRAKKSAALCGGWYFEHWFCNACCCALPLMACLPGALLLAAQVWVTEAVGHDDGCQTTIEPSNVANISMHFTTLEKPRRVQYVQCFSSCIQEKRSKTLFSSNRP